MQGRIAVRASGASGQGKLDWRQQDEVADIRLSGPLGAGALSIHWTPDDVTVADGDSEHRYRGDDAAGQFLADRLGWQFPARSIRYWLLGVPDPEEPYEQVSDEAGALRTLKQSGWQIDYQRFTSVGERILPAKLQVQGADVRLRVIVDGWDVR